MRVTVTTRDNAHLAMTFPDSNRRSSGWRRFGAAMACFPIFFAVIENDLRRVLAYSMINQVGFMVVGFGVSSVVPLVYSAAGKSKVMSPGMALAAVSTIGFLGFLFGPPLIGLVAGATSLRVSYSLIAVMGLCVTWAATRVKL